MTVSERIDKLVEWLKTAPEWGTPPDAVALCCDVRATRRALVEAAPQGLNVWVAVEGHETKFLCRRLVRDVVRLAVLVAAPAPDDAAVTGLLDRVARVADALVDHVPGAGRMEAPRLAPAYSPAAYSGQRLFMACLQVGFRCDTERPR